MKLNNIKEISINDHHQCCIETLAQCYKSAPWELKDAIFELIRTAKKMGADIDLEDIDNDFEVQASQIKKSDLLIEDVDVELSRIKELSKSKSIRDFCNSAVTRI